MAVPREITMKDSIRTLLPEELEKILVDDLGEKKFRVAQILRWIFVDHAET